LAGQARASKVSFLARPRTYTAGQLPPVAVTFRFAQNAPLENCKMVMRMC